MDTDKDIRFAVIGHHGPYPQFIAIRSRSRRQVDIAGTGQQNRGSGPFQYRLDFYRHRPVQVLFISSPRTDGAGVCAAVSRIQHDQFSPQAGRKLHTGHRHRFFDIDNDAKRPFGLGVGFQGKYFILVFLELSRQIDHQMKAILRRFHCAQRFYHRGVRRRQNFEFIGIYAPHGQDNPPIRFSGNELIYSHRCAGLQHQPNRLGAGHCISGFAPTHTGDRNSGICRRSINKPRNHDEQKKRQPTYATTKTQPASPPFSAAISNKIIISQVSISLQEPARPNPAPSCRPAGQTQPNRQPHRADKRQARRRHGSTTPVR